ncbi:MAG: IS3 family transposase [Shewanella sp.]|nr:IS3 family transposase [Shewanella sp.]MCG7936363.1 IS3 family transposase [Candidatus Thiodiazotropha taylori]
MKKRYSEEQIIKAIKQHEAGGKVEDICRELGISNGTFYNWRSKYAGLEVNEAKRLRELESENAKLKKLLADKLLEVEAMKDVLFKKVVKPARRKPIVARLVEHFQLSERMACTLVGLSRTAYRYKAKPKRDHALRERLKTLAAQHSRYGYLLLHGLLKAEGLVVNKKRTYRLYTEERLQVRTKKRKKLQRPRLPMEVPIAANQRWSMDFVSDQLSSGRRFRVLNVVDDYSREIVGQLVATSISGQQVARFLDQLADSRGLPPMIVCDNGPEFTSKALFFWAKERRTKLGFIQPGKPTQNAFVESLNGKFRNECLNQHWFRSLDEARWEIEQWRNHYNHIRPHSALGYIPPVEFAKHAA